MRRSDREIFDQEIEDIIKKVNMGFFRLLEKMGCLTLCQSAMHGKMV